jgi:hypothetical protein
MKPFSAREKGEKKMETKKNVDYNHTASDTYKENMPAFSPAEFNCATSEGENTPDAPARASVTRQAVSDAKQVICLTDRTILPLLPPYQDVPPDCRRIWLEIYAELVRGR